MRLSIAILLLCLIVITKCIQSSTDNSGNQRYLSLQQLLIPVKDSSFTIDSSLNDTNKSVKIVKIIENNDNIDTRISLSIDNNDNTSDLDTRCIDTRCIALCCVLLLGILVIVIEICRFH